MKPIIVLGAGAHAVVVLDVLRLMRREVQGICDPQLNAGDTFEGIPVLLEQQLEKYSPTEYELVNSIGSTKSLELRKKIFKKYKALGFNFASLIHPSAVIAEQLTLGEGVQIMAGAIIQPKAVIGDNTIINTRAIVEHDCHLGSSVHVAPGAVLCGGIKVGEGTHIGAGAVIIQNLSLGKNVLVGANSTVLTNIIDGQKVITRKQELI